MNNPALFEVLSTTADSKSYHIAREGLTFLQARNDAVNLTFCFVCSVGNSLNHVLMMKETSVAVFKLPVINYFMFLSVHT
jgi:hypothetical protein